MKTKITLSQIGSALETLAELLAIAAEATHRADRVIESRCAIQPTISNEEDHA